MPIDRSFADVRVVNDLTGERHWQSGEALPRLVGVLHRSLDAVAETELAREMDGEPPGAVREVVALDAFDEIAVVALGEHAGDGVLHVETFAKDQ
jgi:hypothetical protein